jgi:hypothetical protein
VGSAADADLSTQSSQLCGNIEFAQTHVPHLHFRVLQGSMVLLGGRSDVIVAGGAVCAQNLDLAFDSLKLGIKLGEIPRHQLGIMIAGCLRRHDTLLLDELLHIDEPTTGFHQCPQHVGLAIQIGEKTLAGAALIVSIGFDQRGRE